MVEPIRILIVDDSRIFRCAVEQALADVPNIAVVGSVWSGTKALEVLRTQPVDLVTLDVEMPGMNGLATLQRIQELNAARPDRPPIGVLMVSAYTRAGADVTMQALQAGAFDFVTKPEADSCADSLEILRGELLPRIRLFASRQRKPGDLPPRGPVPRTRRRRPVRALLIAASTGGPKALAQLVPALCALGDLPIFVVQHLPPPFTSSLAACLASHCPHQVIEAQDGETVKARTVYIAPAGRHLVLRAETGGTVVTALTDQPAENGCRPSADVLFRSAASVYGGAVVALVLTGMGCDGAAGLGPLHRAGAHVIAQDEASSVVWGMPSAAHAAGLVDEILPLSAIPAAVAALLAPSPRR